ncbi:hypothetical protein E2C01_034216 [Portunus trituberculatus]|uniref:Uncharacterized protein n=1 Tax=Portunus trituberculatus TaxID=210409 RepID=A0A5B7F0V6_PORTR|nr:hypothetical protein [Portunus trituberculatus]
MGWWCPGATRFSLPTSCPPRPAPPRARRVQTRAAADGLVFLHKPRRKKSVGDAGGECASGPSLSKEQAGVVVIMLHHCLNRWQPAHHLRLARVRLLSPRRTGGATRRGS